MFSGKILYLPFAFKIKIHDLKCIIVDTTRLKHDTIIKYPKTYSVRLVVYILLDFIRDLRYAKKNEKSPKLYEL